MPSNFCGLCRLSYSTIQYPKIYFWRAEFFFQVEFMKLFLHLRGLAKIYEFPRVVRPKFFKLFPKYVKYFPMN